MIMKINNNNKIDVYQSDKETAAIKNYYRLCAIA